jgi:stage V sporulation protein R
VHSGTTATPPGGFNPYKIGWELFRDIEERWDRGMFGKEWDECEDYQAKAKWDRKTNLGRQKIFEVRKIHNDLTFMDEFFTEDFCRRMKLFTFARNDRSGEYEIESREFQKVKQQLLTQLANFGQPIIEVIDANHQNRGELLLKHQFEGRDLRADYAELTLRNCVALWRRPVTLETVLDGHLTHLGFDGKDFTKKDLLAT